MSERPGRRLLRHWRGVLGGVVVALMLATGVLAPILAPYSYSNQSLLTRLRPGVDGVILVSGLQRATFLPQVWEKVAQPAMFLDLLSEKAGLPRRAWHTGHPDILTYQVESFHESAVAMP